MALIPLGSFFQAAVGPLARRVLSALGLGVLSYAAVTAAVTALLLVAKNHYVGLPSAILGLAGLGGIGQALGIISGALIYRVAIANMSKIGRVV